MKKSVHADYDRIKQITAEQPAILRCGNANHSNRHSTPKYKQCYSSDGCAR